MTSKPTESAVVDHTDVQKNQNGVPAAVKPLSEAGRAVSEEEYWANYYEFSDIHYEWNNGILEEKPVGDYAQFRLYFWFLNLLHDFLHVHPIARMIGLEMAFLMQLAADNVVIRKPDLGVVLNANPVPLGDKDRSYRGVFDLCIESISDSTPGETARDTVTKKQEYAAGGVQEYYILDERGRVTEFYELSSNGVYVPIRPVNGVIRSTILPGFQFRYADIYRRPQPPELLDDEVYQGFVSPFIRAERERTAQERQRADRAQQRAERYAAMLAKLGVSVDDDEL